VEVGTRGFGGGAPYTQYNTVLTYIVIETAICKNIYSAAWAA